MSEILKDIDNINKLLVNIKLRLKEENETLEDIENIKKLLENIKSNDKETSNIMEQFYNKNAELAYKLKYENRKITKLNNKILSRIKNWKRLPNLIEIIKKLVNNYNDKIYNSDSEDEFDEEPIFLVSEDIY
jgi:uncharacterized coiled-coil DUF342 family protein